MEIKKQRGRPKNIENIDLISLDDAVIVIEEFWKGKITYSRKTIQNKIYKGELSRYGNYHNILLDRAEVLALFCRSKAG